MSDKRVQRALARMYLGCVSHAPDSFVRNLIRRRIIISGTGKEVAGLYNITNGSRSDGIRYQAYSLRNFAGKKPSAGTNNIMVTHGFNIKSAFGTAVDEGYCMVLKPDDSKASLADSYGALPVGDVMFQFDNDAFPVDAIARMSPESALLMQSCSDVQADAIHGAPEDRFLLTAMDANHDMKITRAEFRSYLAPASNADDAYELVRSVAIPPKALGKPADADAGEPAIELGQFYRINWGWREWAATGGDLQYPWRHILENTIGPVDLGASPAARVAAFREANSVLAALVARIVGNAEFPNWAAIEEKLIACNAGSAAAGLEEGASDLSDEKIVGPSYFPVGASDGGAAAQSVDSIFGIKLTYPSDWAPDFYKSKLMVVGKCLGIYSAVPSPNSTKAKPTTEAESETSTETELKTEVETTAKNATQTEIQTESTSANGALENKPVYIWLLLIPWFLK